MLPGIGICESQNNSLNKESIIVFMMKLYFTGTLGMFCMVSSAHMWMISFEEDLPDSKVLSLID